MKSAQEKIREVIAGAARFGPEDFQDTNDGAGQFRPPDEDDEKLPFGSEQDLADDFVAGHGQRFRWTPAWDWMTDAGTHWTRDDLLRRYCAAKEVARKTASKLDSAKVASKICAASTANALLSLARSDCSVATPVDAWDCHPMLLNTPNGVYDLETGREVSRKGLLFTQLAGASPQAMLTPAWGKFITEVFGGNLETIEFIQRMCGYLLTGSIKEQKLFFMHGCGANGKSVLLDVIRAVGGTYSHTIVGDLRHGNYSNSVELSRQFVTMTLRRHLVAWEQAIAKQLLTDAGRRIYFAEHVVEGLLRGDSANRASFYASGIAAGWLKPSEARRLENLPVIDGIDDFVTVTKQPAPFGDYPSKQA